MVICSCFGEGEDFLGIFGVCRLCVHGLGVGVGVTPRLLFPSLPGVSGLAVAVGSVLGGGGCLCHLPPREKHPFPLGWQSRGSVAPKGSCNTLERQQEEFHGRAEMSFLSSLEQCKCPS